MPLETNPEAARIPKPVLDFPMDWTSYESYESSSNYTIPLPSPRRHHRQPTQRTKTAQGHTMRPAPNNLDHPDDLLEGNLRKQFPQRVSTAFEDLMHKFKDGWQTLDGNMTEALASRLPTAKECDKSLPTNTTRNTKTIPQPQLYHFDSTNLHLMALDNALQRLKARGHPSKLAPAPDEAGERGLAPTKAATEEKSKAEEMLNLCLEKMNHDFEIVNPECDEEWEQVTGEDGEWEVVGGEVKSCTAHSQ